ncbi:HNH endonuclease [Corynebacterium sp. 805_CJEI]|uniref:HNH endonuclease n=1 Tax=Corynebacterium sp. 805_CJEI TaxID=2715677 RepID=UPI0009BBEE3D
MWTNTKHVPTHTRQHILNRDHHTCQHCGTPAPPTHLEIDHITPITQGGDNNNENLQTLCRPCHDRKTRLEARAGKRRQTSATRHPGDKHPGLV